MYTNIFKIFHCLDSKIYSFLQWVASWNSFIYKAWMHLLLLVLRKITFPRNYLVILVTLKLPICLKVQKFIHFCDTICPLSKQICPDYWLFEFPVFVLPISPNFTTILAYCIHPNSYILALKPWNISSLTKLCLKSSSEVLKSSSFLP